MRILFLSAWFPYPADNGSKLRIFNLLSGLSAQHEITLLSFVDDPGKAQVNGLQEICDSVRAIPNKEYNAHSRRALLGFLGRKPRVLADRYVPEMNDMIQEELSSGTYQLVVASQTYMADYLVHNSQIPAIFEEVEVGVFTDAVRSGDNWFHQSRQQLTLTKLQSYLRTLLPRFSMSTVVSEKEKELLQSLVPGYPAIEVIPNGINLDAYTDIDVEPQPGKLVFTGSLTFSPNYQGMQWFTSRVLPQIIEAYPEVKLTITGKTDGINLPGGKHVQLAGYIDDVRPMIASSWASIAPIFSGGGTRLKILEAFGLRTPVIATSKGAEGLDVEHEKHILIADSEDEFVKETIRLLNDADLRQELIDNAFQLVSEEHDWKVIMPRFLSLIEESIN